ncbi:MAG: peptide deformylase [Halieaceae bacterium]|nr:peptide deformylase [Halieaceae bacterium]
MAIRSVLTDPDPRLRTPCQPVDRFDASLSGLVEDLVDTLADSGAIGLSAPQIGDTRRVLAVHVPDDERGLRVYLNPTILARRGVAIIEESCLSLPGIEAHVWRAAQVHVAFQNERGEDEELEVDGLHAVCLQHEIDHLDGRLFVDRLSWWRRRLLRRAA